MTAYTAATLASFLDDVGASNLKPESKALA